MKIKRWNLIAILLTVWALICAWLGRDDFFNPDRRLRFIIIFALEIACIIGVRTFIKRKHQMQEQREERERRLNDNSGD